MNGMFEQSQDFLGLAAREAKDEVRRLLARIEVNISGLAAKDAAAGFDLRRMAVEFLANAGDAPATRGRPGGENIIPVASRESVGRNAGAPAVPEKFNEIEAMIIEVLEGEASGMHVDAIHELLPELGFEITKGNLSVRLHRMIKTGRLMSTARGCYALSTIERARRHSG